MTERRSRPIRPTREEVHSHAPDIDLLEVDVKGRREMLKEEFDYESDLHIDPNYLDAEFLNHSLIFMRYCKESAAANKRAKLAEERVKTVRSQLIKESGEKSADLREAYYRLDERYIKVKEAWIDAVYEADLFSNAVFAFQARKSALENLVRLHGQSYFSTPQEPHDLPEASTRLRELKEDLVENKIRRRTNGR